MNIHQSMLLTPSLELTLSQHPFLEMSKRKTFFFNFSKCNFISSALNPKFPRWSSCDFLNYHLESTHEIVATGCSITSQIIFLMSYKSQRFHMGKKSLFFSLVISVFTKSLLDVFSSILDGHQSTIQFTFTWGPLSPHIFSLFYNSFHNMVGFLLMVLLLSVSIVLKVGVLFENFKLRIVGMLLRFFQI